MLIRPHTFILLLLFFSNMIYAQDSVIINSGFESALQYKKGLAKKIEDYTFGVKENNRVKKTATSSSIGTITDTPLLTGPRVLIINPRVIKIGDTLWVYSGICKVLQTSAYPYSHFAKEKKNKPKRVPSLRIDGTIYYDFQYRSFVDTPFSQESFQQHTIQTALNITVRDNYPLRLNFSVSFNNSPYFRNFLATGLQFDQHAYTANLKQKLLNKLNTQLAGRQDLKVVEAALEREREKYAALDARLNDPDIIQGLIEEREEIYYKQIARSRRSESIPTGGSEQEVQSFLQRYMSEKANRIEKQDSSRLDSLIQHFNLFIDNKKKQRDSLNQLVQKLEKMADSIRSKASGDIAKAKEIIYKAKDPKSLEKIANTQVADWQKEKGFAKFLVNIKSAAIGRTTLNYSELTAWNLALTGVSLEYNPGIYAAIAAGKIDYGFRDFLGRNIRNNGQHLLMARAGFGDKEKRAIILSVFTGAKNSYGSFYGDTVSSRINLTGFSIESIWKKNEHTGISVELAKTTQPFSGSVGNRYTSKALFNFSDNSNLGLSFKAQSLIVQTETKISGFFRKTGENFQSFNLFNYNTDQAAWLLKVDQPFLKNKIGLVVMLRRNDFTNPFTERTYKTSTVFKSFQLNMRWPKWPMLSLGYYPGTQLYVINRERISENVYYILNGTLTHNYRIGGVNMLSMAMYNQNASKGSDIGFIAYKGKSYLASQSVILNALQLQGLFSYTDQEQMRYSTLETNVDYTLKKMIQISGGLRYNKVIEGEYYWGSRVQLSVDIKTFGNIRLQYDKSYLPTIYRTLFPVKTGRISWYKTF